VLFAESITVSLRLNCVLERVENLTRVWVVIRIFRVSPTRIMKLNNDMTDRGRPPDVITSFRIPRINAQLICR
jgi:hypothetical protein